MDRPCLRESVQFPKPAVEAVKRLEAIVTRVPGATTRSMFGQPAAFVAGKMFAGVFGAELIVRVPKDGIVSALERPGARTFEPMPGRPMTGFVVLSASILENRRELDRWLDGAVGAARSAATTKSRAGKRSASPKPTRRP